MHAGSKLSRFHLVAVLVAAVTLFGSLHVLSTVARVEEALPVQSLHRERDFSALLYDVADLEWALRLAVADPRPESVERLGFHLDLAALRQRDNRSLYGLPVGALLERELAALDTLLGGEITPDALRQRLEAIAAVRADIKQLTDANFQDSMEQASVQRAYLSGHRQGMLIMLALFGIFGMALAIMLLRQSRNINLLRARDADLRKAAAAVEADNRLRKAIDALQAGFISSADPQERYGMVLRQAVELTGSDSGFVARVSATEGRHGLCAAARRTGGGIQAIETAALADHHLPALATAVAAVLAASGPVIDNAPGGGAGSALAVPIVGDGRTLAVLALLDRPGGYGAAVAEYLGPLVGACGNVLEAEMARMAERQLLDRLALQSEELARSNTDLEQFAYVVSHDLRQPLRMVRAYTQLLERKLAAALDDETREMMGFVTEGAARMDGMLVSLLEYSRVGRMGEPMAPLPSREVVDEALLFLGPAIAEAGARVTLAGEWPEVTASRDELTRLFQNLIGNAVKFRTGERPPEIALECRADADCWVFAVSDNGIGIPADQLDRLFKVFQRLHTPGSFEGTGIGLAICRRIVERHGGRIWVESGAEGQGSRFCFTLPR
ncbi:ATP-binding protein [Magnetospirillum sp. UT-4]|uniref:sensor histidine kinase n=1 Tax=Magnetospirillum sp. UT-4 TaxID=2681467 RepID=UPI001380B5E1|nr:ATP-binding protein [Magnetospirillum sp. UT-4]CAA7615086.1 ATP-binding region, ATPase-like:Histidine kinase A-like (modular protein) [Magnetospirillum sp. UT-4]